LSVLDLGEQPLANAFRGPDELGRSEARFPLRLSLCPWCSLLQTTHAVPWAAADSDEDGGAGELERLSRNGGTGTVEIAYVKNLLDLFAFDTIHHARACYFSLTAAVSFLASRGLVIDHAERAPDDGGALRVHVRRGGAARGNGSVASLLEEERRWGVAEPRAYIGFARDVRAAKAGLLELLEGLSERGHSVAAYGPAARVGTLLNTLGIGELVEFVADPDPRVQGLYIPGAELEIVAPEALSEARPDYLLLLPGTSANELNDDQRRYRAQGGKLIVPTPRPAVR
jgi:hypothetical protein